MPLIKLLCLARLEVSCEIANYSFLDKMSCFLKYYCSKYVFPSSIFVTSPWEEQNKDHLSNWVSLWHKYKQENWRSPAWSNFGDYPETSNLFCPPGVSLAILRNCTHNQNNLDLRKCEPIMCNKERFVCKWQRSYEDIKM